MEVVRSTPTNCHILTNSPALHSLKRQQLVQLCKRNGIKASGKNTEIVEKLKAHALAHPLESSSFGGQAFFSDDDDGDKENKCAGTSRPSEAWSVIEDDSREVERVHLGLKDIREEVEHEMSNMSPLKVEVSTIRLVQAVPPMPSPPVLRPFTPTFELSYSPGSPSIPALYPTLSTEEDSDFLPPSGFPEVFSTPTGPPRMSGPIPQPFVFGSPEHHISNTEFNSAATSVLAEMNTRLGLTGTTNEVGLDLLQSRRNAGAAPSPELQDRPQTDVTSMFDRAHERQFQKMEGLSEWYARRNAASPSKSGPQDMGANKKRKSDVLGGLHRKPLGQPNTRTRRGSRVITPGTRRSLVAAAEIEDMDGRKTKRVRISVVEDGQKGTGAAENQSLGESGMDEDGGTAKLNEERERERAAIKKKLELSRARRRSSMGRVSVGGSRPPLIPNQPKKGMATKFGFLASARSIVKNVWKSVGSSAPKPTSTIPVPGSSQRTVSKKSSPNLLTKAAPVAKASVAKPPLPKASTAKPDPNTTLRIPATGIGLGRKTSTRTSTTSTAGTGSSTASSGMTRSSTSSLASGMPTARRGPIPAFQQPFTRVSRSNSLANSGGTLSSRTSSSGTGSSRGTSAANSIGLQKPVMPSNVRSSDVGNRSTNSVVKGTSTLFAPTASSLAKMQSTARPLSLSTAAARPGAIGAEPKAKALAKVPEQMSPVHSGLPSFTYTSPPPAGGNALSPNEVIFSHGAPTFSPMEVPTSEIAVSKPPAFPTRRPRISRSRVIARVGAQRAASGSLLTRTPSGRRSFNAPKNRGSLGVRVSGIGLKSGARDNAAMSARKRLRQSEILRRRSKFSEMSSAHLEQDGTPDGGDGNSTAGDQ